MCIRDRLSTVFNARYEWPISETLRASVQGNGKYQSAFYLDAEGLEDRRQSGHEIIDASAALHLSNGIDLGVWGRNLSDSNYAVSGFGFIGYNRFLGAPRSYGMSLKYSY